MTNVYELLSLNIHVDEHDRTYCLESIIPAEFSAEGQSVRLRPTLRAPVCPTVVEHPTTSLERTGKILSDGGRIYCRT